MIHEMKALPKYFSDVLSGRKGFEARKFDRPFHEGDLLALNEFENNAYTGRSCLVYIDYMLSDPEYVKDGYVILGIKPCEVMRVTEPFNIAKLRHDYGMHLATDRFVESEEQDER